MLDARNTNGEPLIDTASEEMKKYFWNKKFYWFRNQYRWAVSQSKQYSTLQNYTALLYYAVLDEEIAEEELFDLFERIEYLEIERNNNDLFHLKELLNKIQKIAIHKTEWQSRVFQLESIFSSILQGEELVITIHLLKQFPEYYIEICKKLYKKDHLNKAETLEPNEGKYYSDRFYKIHFCPAERDGKVDETELENWCKQFKKQCAEEDISSKYTYLLGRVLAFSPTDPDGYTPCVAIRNVIEQEYDKGLHNGYTTSMVNKRGVYTVNAGEGEKALAMYYKDCADYLRTKWPYTARIYDNLYDLYRYESDEERRNSELEF